MSFAAFSDQQHIVQLLQRSLEKGRLAHGYLFTGSDPGVLEAMAQTLAKTLNCAQPPRRGGGMALDCCDHCLNCQRIGHENHPDVQWIRPESKSRAITIDQIRDLMQTINLKPMEADYKVMVIVAADRLNTQAANAFLKTLEEPPARSVLILLTGEPGRVLETVVSRCLRLNFSGEAGFRVAGQHLEWLKTFSELVKNQGKTLLDRYRWLGSLTAKLNALKSEIDTHLTQRSPLERYADADSKLRDKWETELAAAIEAEYRRQRTELIAGIQAWLRDVWVATQALPVDQLCLPGLAGATQAVAARINPEQAMENLGVIEDLQRILESNVQEALALEVSFLKLQL